MDKASGLDAGADDYITKPFAIEELLARIRVALKKRSGRQQETKKLFANGVIMDVDRHQVTVRDQNVELNHREYELVRVLLTNKNIVMNRQQLMNQVCGYDYMGETILSTHTSDISALRSTIAFGSDLLRQSGEPVM